MNRYLCFTVFFLLIIIFITFEDVHAGNNSGPCKTECQPPSLGLDLKESRRYVSDGFGINGQFYDVEYFSQTIPTQNFIVGDIVNIRLTIFENTGYQYLEYVGLSIVVDEPNIRGGMVIEKFESTIEWIQKFDGTKSIDVNDPFDLLNVINVTDSIDNNRTILDYTFSITQPMESKAIKVLMWDYNRNVWSNHFYDVITVTQKNDGDLASFQNNSDGLDIENIDTSNFPKWVQNIFSWYYDGIIEEAQLIQILEFLIHEEIIKRV
jgi:hypothetical protein